MEKIIELIRQDPMRVQALRLVAQLNLPQCYIAAGFIRNLVWDSLHNLERPTPLNDVDVIYFDPEESSLGCYLLYEAQLTKLMPELNWQVRNQATMHVANGDLPYASSLDAMRHWPEKETAIGIRQITLGQYECIAAFGFESLFKGYVTFNPISSRQAYDSRLKSKNWLKQWPLLKASS
ncbi:nucleotidyltransferase family protein [Vibrio sp. WXL210]|uniref:nucleotidyltransferase family protein n=1 Tax=Vibrio sp. WXL210 TaxID=3450709 RepID=UPI003EC60C90